MLVGGVQPRGSIACLEFSGHSPLMLVKPGFLTSVQFPIFEDFDIYASLCQPGMGNEVTMQFR